MAAGWLYAATESVLQRALNLQTNNNDHRRVRSTNRWRMKQDRCSLNCVLPMLLTLYKAGEPDSRAQLLHAYEFRNLSLF
jgi:hypothetical protein